MVLIYGEDTKMINFDSLCEVNVRQSQKDSSMYTLVATTNGADKAFLPLTGIITKELAEQAFKKIKTCLAHGDAICDLQEFIG